MDRTKSYDLPSMRLSAWRNIDVFQIGEVGTLSATESDCHWDESWLRIVGRGMLLKECLLGQKMVVNIRIEPARSRERFLQEVEKNHTIHRF